MSPGNRALDLLAMTREEYLAKSNDFKERLDFVRWSINAHVTSFGNNTVQQIKPLLKLQRETIAEIVALDKEYFNDC